MHGEVHQLLVATRTYVVGNELCLEHAVTALARYIGNAICGQMQIASQQTGAAFCIGHAGNDNGAVLVAIAGK
jgi:hypothetical protein